MRGGRRLGALAGWEGARGGCEGGNTIKTPGPPGNFVSGPPACFRLDEGTGTVESQPEVRHGVGSTSLVAFDCDSGGKPMD